MAPSTNDPAGGKTRTVRILIQTTTRLAPDDWSIDSLTLLREHLSSLDESGTRFEVVARNRETPAGTPEPALADLDRSDFDELWLFGFDQGDGLTPEDCQGISRFRQRGGGMMVARDHQDMGVSVCSLGGIGLAQHFHSRNPDPDLARCMPDDTGTPTISWPNYHSGKNGDFQRVSPVEPLHELLVDASSRSPRVIELFPSHPHEGAVGVPEGETKARVVATGRSLVTGRSFNLAVAFDRTTDRDGKVLGRGIAESSFHHFADYNWDPSRGAPSFVTEPAGEGMRLPQAQADIRRYVRNAAFWLAPTRP